MAWLVALRGRLTALEGNLSSLESRSVAWIRSESDQVLHAYENSDFDEIEEKILRSSSLPLPHCYAYNESTVSLPLLYYTLG